MKIVILKYSCLLDLMTILPQVNLENDSYLWFFWSITSLQCCSRLMGCLWALQNFLMRCCSLCSILNHSLLLSVFLYRYGHVILPTILVLIYSMKIASRHRLANIWFSPVMQNLPMILALILAHGSDSLILQQFDESHRAMIMMHVSCSRNTFWQKKTGML